VCLLALSEEHLEAELLLIILQEEDRQAQPEEQLIINCE
jgi:hypothetical protein